MDRLNQLRGEAGGSRDSTLDTSSPPSEAFLTANESSKYFSLSEDSEFDISPIKDVSLPTADSGRTITDDQLISNLSPIGKKSDLDSYKIGKQIEAANILSGGVDIFDDNDNSNDGNDLIIDDNAEDEKSELMLVDTAEFKGDEETLENVSETETPSKDTEVVLQIDGKNVDAIDIGNGLYLYRKEGEEELAAVQIIDDDQHQPSFKFLKVRENAEGNLEVYEEIQIEVPKEVPAKEGKSADKKISHVPIKDINKVISEPTTNIVADKIVKTPHIEVVATPKESESDSHKEMQSESKEVNFNGKMKLSEARKSPVIGSFTPMAYHSTPNKEGKPLTKTMVDLQLHPSRHSDNVKKTIEVHTDHSKIKSSENKNTKDVNESKSSKCKSEIKAPEEKNIVGVQNEKHSQISTESKQNVKDGTIMNIDTDTKTSQTTETNKIDMPKEKKTTDTEEYLEDKNDKDSEKNVKSTIENSPSKSNLNVKNSTALVTKTSGTNPNKTSEQPAIKNCENTDIVSSSSKEKDGTSSLNIDSNNDGRIKQHEEIPTLAAVKVDKITASQETCQKDSQKIENITLESVENDKSKTVTSDIPAQTNKEEKATAEDRKESKQELSAKPEVLKNETNIPKDSSTSLKPVIAEAAASTKQSTLPIDTQATISSDGVKKCTEVLNVTSKDENVDKKPDAIANYIKPELATTASAHTKTEILTKKSEEPNKNISNEIKPTLQQIDNSHKNIDVKSIEITEVAAPSMDVDKKEIPKLNKPVQLKPINNNHAAVPFGKWTEANRQEFLNKIRESKVPTNHSNGKQIKNSNDLNRRDILKKIDSQRSNIATAKAQEMANIAKLGQGVKKEAPIFINQTSVTQDTKIPLKTESDVKTKPAIICKRPTKQETVQNQVPEPTAATVSSVKNQPRAEINNQDLIDRTIDDIINRSLPVKSQEDTNQNVVKEHTAKSKHDVKPLPVENPKGIERKPVEKPLPVHRPKPIEIKPHEILKPVDKSKPIDKPKLISSHNVKKNPPNTLLDDIEMEMNKLHGIPFVERPQHELPQVSQRQPLKTYGKVESDKTSNKHSKVPKLLPFVNKGQQKMVKESTIDLDSEEEIIEHEPITGDIEVNKNEIITKPSSTSVSLPSTLPDTDASKKEAIITENDFDKFARRNSKTYENCLKVNFDGSESHNVIKTVVEKDNIKMGPKPESVCIDKTLTQKQEPIIPKAIKQHNTMFCDSDKNYPSKVKMAYQSVMTAKRQLERPITIIEDKPVKVMYVDSNMDYYPNTLNVQGKELDPQNKVLPGIDINAISSCDSLDSDIIETHDDAKSQDDVKLKTKHQRKQVLTPVENPDLELIEPEDLGLVTSPKKKRRTEESKIEKSAKALVPKKSYLLGRNTTSQDKMTTIDLSQSSYKEPVIQEEPPKTHNAASAIDSLVKAAALIETQSENVMKSVTSVAPNPDSQPVTPVKRGRGRPRKYPLPEGEAETSKAPSPQKKPRLIDAKIKKPEVISDDDSSADEIIKENWTMGKINENIVCPICSKLFRSENVVFKHVKHCTGPSPSRSDSDKRSPRRGRYSQESESTDSKMTDETDAEFTEKIAPKKRKSKESPPKLVADKDNSIILIEDTPIKERIQKREVKKNEEKKQIKNMAPEKVNNLICEFCGKTFRQLSYLVSHRLQHGKEEQKKVEPAQVQSKSVFSCDVCKKEFRKLHHLVQHRIIHNPNAIPARLSRKSSSEQKDNKVEKDQVPKQSDDPSAGFRCEPCDKSFRKLHHLVEHRETHDGINRQKNTPAVPVSDKLPPPPQCEVCKKTFRKLHHLIEHKEQHLETSSEKSDDKSVKSSLSTKDIIHECSLCYMVFPNEHSLNKHTVICQKKKKQSAAKALKQTEDGSAEKDDKDENNSEASKHNDDIEVTEIPAENKEVPIIAQPEPVKKLTESKLNTPEQKSRTPSETEKPKPIVEKENEKDIITTEPISKSVKEVKQTEIVSKIEEDIDAKIEKVEKKETGKTPKKRTPAKEKSATIIKRQKSVNAPLPVVDEVKPIESSDDDEVRYMLNPDFKADDTTESKIFMKVKAKKRNSLQIERPNSKDLVKRRISLQHPPKIPRLKPKPVEVKAVPVNTVKNVPKPDLDPVPSTDSDDSDVKYSFPKTVAEKAKQVAQETPKEERKAQRKSLADKRKSLGAIAKRKSMGKVIMAKHKAKPSPLKPIKRRTAEVEHRCDCGQLFSSAALLARHASLAHTPPRIRRKRSPPPPLDTNTIVKPPRKSTTGKPKPGVDSRKSSTRSDTSNTPKKTAAKTDAKVARKSLKVEESKKTASNTKTDAREARKSLKVEESKKTASGTKTRRSTAHRGVPVPEKMRKLMEKNK